MALYRFRKSSVARGQNTLELLRPTPWRQRLARIALFVIGIIALCSFFDLRAFSYLERYGADLRMNVHGAQHGSFEQRARENIVILAISDDSFEPTNNQRLPVDGPPVPRSFHAKVIRDLTRAGVKAIAFDLLFTTPRPPDKELAQAARDSGRVIWACRFQESNNDSSTGQEIILPVPTLLRAHSQIGHINAPKDEEHSAVTRIPAAVMYRGQPVPAFSVMAAQTSLGLQDTPLQRTAHGWRIGDLTIPVDDGHFAIKYFGTAPGEVIPYLPYEKIVHGYIDSPYYKANEDNPAISLRDKIVLIGDTTSLGHDVVMTPLKEMPGVEVHAHAIATILQNSFTRPVAPATNLAILGLVTILTSAMAARWRSTWALAGALSLLIGYCCFNVWIFVEHGTVLRLVAPCAAIVLATLLGVTERNLTVERARLHACALLQRYVSPQIANYILSHPEKAALGGTRVTATVLFSDIRGFTSLSEKLTPEEVLSRLNEYLQAMTDVVFKHNGAVDKYIGDAVMALYGVPLLSDDHAIKAVATAIEMQEALFTLQEKWRAEGLPLIDIGIGINTGELVFGNMGANERMDFSVLGDTVNLASRVESLNKEMNSRILVTASTYEYVQNQVRADGPFEAHVKGKEKPVIIYKILGWREETTANENRAVVMEDANETQLTENLAQFPTLKT